MFITPSPYWQLQGLPDCVEQSVRVSLDLTGHHVSESVIDAHAEAVGVFLPGVGTVSPKWFNLIGHYGGTASPLAPMSRARLDRALAAGSPVIAFVNANTIWMPEGYQSSGGTTLPDHSVTIVGDGPAGVTLIDTGVPVGNGEVVPWSTFTKAWSTSGWSATVVS